MWIFSKRLASFSYFWCFYTDDNNLVVSLTKALPKHVDYDLHWSQAVCLLKLRIDKDGTILNHNVFGYEP